MSKSQEKRISTQKRPAATKNGNRDITIHVSKKIYEVIMQKVEEKKVSRSWVVCNMLMDALIAEGFSEEELRRDYNYRK